MTKNTRRRAIPQRPLAIRPEGNGFALEGRGFYIWDEDRNEVLRMAHDLAQGGRPLRPTRRLLIVGR